MKNIFWDFFYTGKSNEAENEKPIKIQKLKYFSILVSIRFKPNEKDFILKKREMYS